MSVEYHGGTLLTKEMDVMNAIKAGNAAIGTPSGAAATIFPEMGVFLVPYLVQTYPHAYKILNGAAGDKLDGIFQQKYGVKVLFYFDLGFRHFWNSKRPINEPRGPARPETCAPSRRKSSPTPSTAWAPSRCLSVGPK